MESSWLDELADWMEPFLRALGHKRRCRWAAVYLKGLLGPGERKSMEPICERLAPGQEDQLNHFVAQAPWDPQPLWRVLAAKANALAGGTHSVMIVDDTALVKKGRHSVGVAHQYCGQLGKKANCQALVSLTLARGEVPIVVSLRLFLPESWTSDPQRCRAAGLPDSVSHVPKWKLALEELDRAREGVGEFGAVVADAAYGMAGEFRLGLQERRCLYGVGIQPQQRVYPPTVVLHPKHNTTGRPRLYDVPDQEECQVRDYVERHGRWKTISWRRATKGKLQGRFCAMRVRLADGIEAAQGRRLPGAPMWLIGEQRPGGERRYYVSNLPPQTSLKTLVGLIKARWSCEQAHQQMKQELGLDHFEGRSWRGLCHHVLMVMIAYCFLQHLRLGGKKGSGQRKRAAS